MRQITMISILEGRISATVSMYGSVTQVSIEDRDDWTTAERDDYIMQLASFKIIYGAMSHE